MQGLIFDKIKTAKRTFCTEFVLKLPGLVLAKYPFPLEIELFLDTYCRDNKFQIFLLICMLLYVQEVVTQPKILNRTISQVEFI